MLAGICIVYLSSVILCIFVMGLIATQNDRINIENQRDVFCMTAFFLFWPLVVLAIPVMALYDHYEGKLEREASQIISKYNVKTIDENDRAGVVGIPESELKLLLKAVRKDCVQLSPEQIKVVREELQNRVVEKSLLR
jgi:hypothetical protein